MSDGRGSTAVTEGIRVQVRSQYLPEHSSGPEMRYAFSYQVTITNESRTTSTLLARHWAITDGAGNVEHVRGPGVVGAQPTLVAGQTYTYQSGAVLRTPNGMMEGEYLFEREDGTRFEAVIAPFALVTPESIH